MKTVKKPWGCEIWFAHNDKYVGKMLLIKKGCRLSRQYHKVKHETHYAIKGKYIMEVNGRERTVKEGQATVLKPGTIHRMYAKFEDIQVVEASTPEVWDIVRLDDDYGRLPKKPK